MCWTNSMAIPIVLKKPLKVYKVGTTTTLGTFISLYQDTWYYKSRAMPTVEITPKFKRSYTVPGFLWKNFLGRDTFDIYEGYHSYLTEDMANYRMCQYEVVGIFEIPAGATIYVNYHSKEVVSTDIKYLGLLEQQKLIW